MWKCYNLVKIWKFNVLGGYRYPKWPPLGQKMNFLSPKKVLEIFSESSSKNMMLDTKTKFLSFVDPKLWAFKVWRYPKTAKFWKVHNTPPRVPRAKKFWFSKFLPRGYLYAKNDQNRGGKGVKSLWSALDPAFFLFFFIQVKGPLPSINWAKSINFYAFLLKIMIFFYSLISRWLMNWLSSRSSR